MESEIKKEISVETELIAGSGGVFEIFADNQEIFSKKKQNRFPETNEIIELIKNI